MEIYGLPAMVEILLSGIKRAGVLMYDGKKFHEYTDFLKYLNSNQLPAEVYYNKNMDKLFLTTFNIEGEIFTGKIMLF